MCRIDPRHVCVLDVSQDFSRRQTPRQRHHAIPKKSCGVRLLQMTA
jgi:hypothetical protein